MSKANRSRPKAGEKILAGLRELHDAIVGGDVSKLTLRTVEIPDPRSYGPRDIKSLRHSLKVSQGVFADLVAVSAVLVAQWECGIRRPAPVVCRLLDRISEDPAGYVASLVRRKSA
jgi:putative transcriptional regulator